MVSGIQTLYFFFPLCYAHCEQNLVTASWLQKSLMWETLDSLNYPQSHYSHGNRRARQCMGHAAAARYLLAILAS